MTLVRAVHGVRTVERDPDEEIAFADELRRSKSREEILQLAAAHALGEDEAAERMRRAAWRALTRRFGHGVRIGRGAIGSHFETLDIGDGVFIGEQTFIQGRADGRCVIGAHSWIGPQNYLDARDLIIEEYVGWGPGARALGSQHTGEDLSPLVDQAGAAAPDRYLAQRGGDPLDHDGVDRPAQAVLGPEVVDDQARGDPSGRGDRPQAGGRDPVIGEQGQSRLAEPGLGGQVVLPNLD